MKELSKERWDDQAKAEVGYDKVMNRGWDEATQNRYTSEQLTVLHNLGILEDASVVDIGCGMGRFIQALITWNTGAVIGIDLSSEMIEEARKLVEDPGGKATYVCHDLKEGIPLADKSTEIIIAWSILLHIIQDENFENILREMARVSSRYIILGMDEPHQDGQMGWDKSKQEHYFKKRSEEAHYSILRDAGYEVKVRGKIHNGAFTVALLEYQDL